MKIEVNNNSEEPLPFPKLMISGYLIILAEKYSDSGLDIFGTIISNSGDLDPTRYYIGLHRENFDAAKFTDFKGSITLKNE